MGFPGAEQLQKMTPMMRQYFDLKKNCQNAVLFFRMGDFFEVFAEDAEEIAPKLELVLTSRERGDQQRIKFCGVPHHSANSYWLKLLRMNYRVAIADQTEDASQATGLVKREIVKIMTPGCVDELEALRGDAPNYLMGLYEDPETKIWAVAVADVSTGELRLGSVPNFQEALGSIAQFRPREILVRRFVKGRFEAEGNDDGAIVSELPELCLRDATARQENLQRVFGKNVVAPEVAGGDELVAALLQHLVSLNLSTRQFLSVRQLHDPETMTLSETVLRDLEIFESMHRRESKGSLFHQINHCLTPMGARFLRLNLLRPLLKEKAIVERHDAVARMMQWEDQGLLRDVRETLKGCPDLERILTRVVAGNIRPAELARLRDGLHQVRQLISKLDTLKEGFDFARQIQEMLREGDEALLLLERALLEAPRALGNGIEIFRVGFDRDLDEKNDLSQNGQAAVDEYQERLKRETDISSLKIKHHNTFGLLIEVTKTHFNKVPSSFVRRQTMVNCERFATEDLKNLEARLVSAQDEAIAREQELFGHLCSSLAQHTTRVRKTAEALGHFDLILGFAWLARSYNYCRPQLTPDRIALRAARHPTVEHYVGLNRYVANDIHLNENKRVLLITGPNMAGKSTAMRLTALCGILNQIGCFVPAQAASLPVFDRVFTRVGAADDLSRGMSTFMVEMAEAAEVLRFATDRSLVILDEVGRGTSTQDGLALASAILEEIGTRTRSWTLFATHFHELVPFARSLPALAFAQTEVRHRDGKVVFTHQLIEGASGHSYGLEVARIAGLPESVVARAQDLLRGDKTCSAPTESAKNDMTPVAVSNVSLVQQVTGNDRFSRALVRLERVRINRTTPIQALNILNELMECLSASQQHSLFDD